MLLQSLSPSQGVIAAQMTAVAAAALCGALAPRNAVELLHTSTAVLLGCGGGAAAAGLLLLLLLLLLKKKSKATSAAGLWLGHSVLCTGGAALIAAWAGGWACCDELLRAVDPESGAVTVMPRSLLGVDGSLDSTSRLCNISTEHAAVGRRAAVACCALALVAFAYASLLRPRASAAAVVADVGRAVGLGGLFTAIACNEDIWDWRPIYAVGIAFVVSSFFAVAAFSPGLRWATLSEKVAAGWLLNLLNSPVI